MFYGNGMPEEATDISIDLDTDKWVEGRTQRKWLYRGTFLRTGGKKDISMMTYIADTLRLIDNLDQFWSDTKITEYLSVSSFFCLSGLFFMMKNETATQIIFDF